MMIFGGGWLDEISWIGLEDEMRVSDALNSFGGPFYTTLQHVWWGSGHFKLVLFVNSSRK